VRRPARRLPRRRRRPQGARPGPQASAPDPAKVKLEQKFYGGEEDSKNPGTFKKGEVVYVNPFQRAFVCRNPSIKHAAPQQPDPATAMDISVLRKLNKGEDFSLLQCKKPVTLAVKLFQTASVVQPKSAKENLFGKLPIGVTKSGEEVDYAAQSAHNLVEVLRKSKLEAYVLHTKYCSIVTVGGYDSLEDPSLRSMQNLLESRLRIAMVEFFPRPVPMKVRAKGEPEASAPGGKPPHVVDHFLRSLTLPLA